MVLAIIFLFVAILSAVGIFSEWKRKNLFGVGFSLLSAGVFGWFSVMTLYSIITTGTGGAM
ncbi:DUF2759 domain-containing protein [Texcoconibacillus texcoconensis]|uniref:DUF2759 domain-containing protein n=1 Tax=Texcoconibacillus texcoconensis TaxID=1095777 RepID=A0A840QNZ4_9BACI|nr:DUF2759 domain-containing protein [Texcoconibacillus texcoconensis]MBB5173116.1 hypothetical protein [Texcoconibacillus texcoconensis]